MCGIIGLFNMKNSEDTTLSEKDKSFLIKYLLAKLTLETETRGKDATGYFALFQNKESIGLKHGVNALKFCTKEWSDDNEKFNFKNHLNLIEAYHNEISPIASILAHCRAKTVGPETDNNNNHPIYVDNMVGIHNGCLSNHYKIANTIQDEITRTGLVDSEMIFQLIWLLTNKGQDKLNNDLVEELTEKLDGSFAVICVDKNDPDSVFFVRDTRPIEFIYIKKAGLLITVSEKKFFENAMVGYNWLRFYGVDLPEIEFEYYSLPDDVGFALDLNKQIEKGSSIEDIIGEKKKIKRTDPEWKSYTSYGTAGTPKRTSTVDRYTERENQKKVKENNKSKTEGTSSSETADSVNKNYNLRKVTKKTENIVKIVTKEASKGQVCIETAKWNTNKKVFEVEYQNTLDVYKEHLDNTFLDKFTIYKNNKMLANKLKMDEMHLDSLTAAQLANRASKIIYDEQVERKDIEIKTLKEKVAKQEIKAEKVRIHIINLRNIANILVTTLNMSYKEGQLNLNKDEEASMSTLWKFLYCTNKDRLKSSVLGKFISELANKETKKSIIGH